MNGYSTAWFVTDATFSESFRSVFGCIYARILKTGFVKLDMSPIPMKKLMFHRRTVPGLPMMHRAVM